MSDLEILLLWITLPLGAALGSFAAAVDSRWHTCISWLSLLTESSHCDGCGRHIPWFENLPLVSWVLLRGRGRCCGHAIGTKTLISELAGAGLLAGLTLSATSGNERGDWLKFLTLVLILSAMVAAILSLTLIDLRTSLLPNPLVFTLMVSAMAFTLWLGATTGSAVPAFWALVSSLTWYAIFWLLRLASRGGMGRGDIKLAAALGWGLGALSVTVSAVGFFLAFAFGAAHGIGATRIRIDGLKQRIPFGPAMLTGFVIAFIFGGKIWDGYLNLFSSFTN